MISMPLMVFGENGGDQDEDYEKSDQYGTFEGFHGGFGGIFRENMGYGGDLLGTLFELLLLDGVDLEDHETLESVYVLSASKEETYEGNYSFVEQGDTQEIHYLPFYNSTGTVNYYDIGDINETAYCIVDKTGGFEYNLTVGAALTLVIWDHDKSFIVAAQKVLDWASRFREAEEKDKVSKKLVAEGVQVLSWLLVHINEIFTGDELFVINPIVWQTLDMDPWKDPGNQFNITKTWYDFGENMIMETGAGDDNKLEDSDWGQDILDIWNLTAGWIKDSYMQWLLKDFDIADLVETIWTQFSFDIAQLWMKKFYIEIDLEEAAKGDKGDVEDAFDGCEIEFYLFTHHLAGAFLYNDNDTSGDITVKYDYVRNETTGEKIYINGTAVMVPTSNEVTHRLILGTVEDFDFKEPKIDKDKEQVSWGLQLNNVNMSAVPVGVDLNSYVNAPEEQLDYIYFGLDFEIEQEEPNKKGEIWAQGDVKLETNWAPWNNQTDPYTNQDIEDLDLAIIYISSILHFELEMEKDDDPDDPDDELLEDGDYKEESHTLKIGNYLDEDEDKLEFVDIAGPGYLLGNSTHRKLYPANTSIIPIALWEGESQMHETNPGDEDDTSDDYATDTKAEAKWNVMLYAVCYPDFNGSGMGIWHDPTFSVYMVFTPESAGFWSLILLIAGIGLAGVATILIKRRKDNRL
jgi:hypothetical protein